MRALDLRGLPLGEATFAFKGNDRETEAAFDLPVEIRNDIARLEIANERSSGAVQLLDKRWRRRTIGVITGATADTAQPLLASTFYLSRALAPFADVRLGERTSPSDAVARFLDQNVPMLILADVGNVAGPARERLTRWIDEGGVLVRFAGPRLAASDDDLVPVKLRRGGRTLGGALSWDKPQPLATFSREGPFNAMPVPGDVTVSRQVLAEPEAGISERTWAALADGTPLVTGAKRGKGLVVLFHVTADTRWSDLPLSGAFVDMLKRVVALAGTNVNAEQTNVDRVRETLAPARVLDGFGAFTSPQATTRPVPANYSARASADYPPGFYGPPEGLLAVNTLTPLDRMNPLDFSPLNAKREGYRLNEPLDLRGPILATALAHAADRCAGGVLACRRHRAPDAPPPGRGRAGHHHPRCRARIAAFRVRAKPPHSAAAPAASRCISSAAAGHDATAKQRSESDRVHARNQTRLCHYRRRGNRRGQQSGPVGADIVPRPAHRAGSRRPGGPRYRAR